ncbi:YdcF family protein [Staphylococcus auricularis]|uniref:YdcF family protein n=1 Tax=Staphylococcus auricularis TaxID=29379 RepID=UPI003EBE3F0A
MTQILFIMISVLVVVLFIGALFKQTYLLNINVFMIHILLGFIIILYHIFDRSIPYELIAVSLIGVVLLQLKHRDILSDHQGRLFLKRLYHMVYIMVLLTISGLYVAYGPMIIDVLGLWMSAITFTMLFSFISFCIWCSGFLHQRNAFDFDLLLILGAGIFSERVTPLLARRLDIAVALYDKTPELQLLVSGGQGPDEPISEARAMQHYLIEHGFPSSQITREPNSVSTHENLKFSHRIIQRQYQDKPNILRALRYAQMERVSMAGIGSQTPYHFLEISLLRDFLALMYEYKLLLTIYFGLLFAGSIFNLLIVPYFF